MIFNLEFTEEAEKNLDDLESDNSLHEHLKAVRKCLGFMETNLKHPSLNTHKMISFKGPTGEQIFVSYPENDRPGAYRIFWYYGKNQTIILTSIVPHL